VGRMEDDSGERTDGLYTQSSSLEALNAKQDLTSYQSRYSRYLCSCEETPA
jgi:hypothetical protein